jgi:hypothetical protein
VTPEFRFNSEDHTYWRGEVRLPGVTEILAGLGIGGDWSFLKDRDFYLARGRAVHACIELHFAGQEIDWDFEGAEHVRPRFEKFLRIAEGLRPVLCETPLPSLLFGYGGTPDYVGPFQRHPLAILDWKGDSSEPCYRLQVSGGYRGLLVEAAQRGELSLDPGDLLHCPAFLIPLGGDTAIPRPALIQDEDGALVDVFRGCAAAYNWKLNHYGDPRS